MKSRYFFLLLCGVSLLLTFSKGAWLIAFFAIFSAFANMLFWQRGFFAKVLVNTILFSTFLLTLLLQAVDGVGSSAFLHFLGLSQKFIEFPSLIGNDLGSGGNYANLDFFEKLERGAESTVGVIFYHIGYLGLSVFLLVYLYCVGILRSEEHTSELQSPDHLVCRLLLEKKKTKTNIHRRRTSGI